MMNNRAISYLSETGNPDNNRVFPRNKLLADLNSTSTFEKKDSVTKMDVATYISS